MITWTNNSTNADNRWLVGETAEWTATGDLPDWITSGDFSRLPVFVFSQDPELTDVGDTWIGAGSVTYNSNTNTLTIQESIRMDLNNWTVQVTGNNGETLRWPGWGAVSARWADPGCHAWDVNVGDRTHEIERTFELNGDVVDNLNMLNLDTRTYNITYELEQVIQTRSVTLEPAQICDLFKVLRMASTTSLTGVNLTITTATPNTRVWVQETIDPAESIYGMVRPVADDEYGNLFVAVGEGISDSGRVVFDTGFPKYYDGPGDVTESELYNHPKGQYPYLANCIKYTCNKPTRANSVCYFLDDASARYSGKFNNAVRQVTQAIGWTFNFFQDLDPGSPVNKPDGDAHRTFVMGEDLKGNEMDPNGSSWTAQQWSDYFIQFDVLVWLGTAQSDWLGSGSEFIAGLMQAFESGLGLVFITDDKNFQHVVNHAIKPFGIQFEGSVDRKNGDEYLVSTMLTDTDYIPTGSHPLFADMGGDRKIAAGSSEGKIVRDTTTTRLSSWVSDADSQLQVNDFFGRGELYITTANDCNTRLPVYEPIATGDGSRPNVLERFTLGGEGGYRWNTYVLQCFDKVFTRKHPWTLYENQGLILDTYKHPSTYDRHTTYTTNDEHSQEITYHVNHGVLRSCQGNKNKTCLYRDGWVLCPVGDFQLDWIPNNLNDIQDIFMPSSYQHTYNQILLMNDGRLLQLPVAALYNEREDSSKQNSLVVTISGVNTSGQTVALDNVTEILTINQAHNEDCIVRTDDNGVWHVGGRTTNFSARQIPDIAADDIMFCQIGDNWDSAWVVFNNEPASLYRMTFQDGTARNLNNFEWITGVEACPNTLVTMDTDEQFVHGCSNEFHSCFITTKRVIGYKCDAPPKQPNNAGTTRLVDITYDTSITNIYCLGACAYSLALSIDGVPHLYCASGYSGMNGYPSSDSKYQYSRNLLQLDPMSDYDALTIELRAMQQLGVLENFDASDSTAVTMTQHTWNTLTNSLPLAIYTVTTGYDAGTPYTPSLGQISCAQPPPTQEVGNWGDNQPPARNGNTGAAGNSFMYTDSDGVWYLTTGTQQMGYYLQMPCAARAADEIMPQHSSMDITFVSGTYTWDQARLDALDRGGQLAAIRYTSQQQLIVAAGEAGWLGGVRVQYREGDNGDGWNTPWGGTGDIDNGGIPGRIYVFWTDSTTPASIVETKTMTSRNDLVPIASGGYLNGNRYASVPEDSPCAAS